jgi:MFS family permease
LFTWPFQPRIDPPLEERMRRDTSFHLSDIFMPLNSLRHGDHLMRASFVGTCLAVPQSGWITFSVTYLVVGLGQSLSTAGLVFAVMQASSMFGRVFLGWLADRITGMRTLMIAAIGSTIATVLLGLSTAAWPLWAFLLLAAFSGFVVSGWNGVQIAEIARRSPPELIGETAAGGVMFIFLTNLVTPVVFAAFVAVTGRYDIAFLVSAAFSLVCVPLLWGIDRGAAGSGG